MGCQILENSFKFPKFKKETLSERLEILKSKMVKVGGRGKSVNGGSLSPFIVALYEGGLSPAVDIYLL